MKKRYFYTLLLRLPGFIWNDDNDSKRAANELSSLSAFLPPTVEMPGRGEAQGKLVLKYSTE